MNRLLFFTFDFPPSVGGIETRTMNYARELAKRGDDLVVVHMLNPADRSRLLRGESRSAEELDGFRVIRYAYSLRATLQLFLTSVRESGFRSREVVHVFTGANTIVGLMYVLLARATGKKTGVSVFGKDLLASKPSGVFFFPLVLSLTAASRIMVNSVSTLNRLPPRMRKKATVHYPGVDPTALSTVRPPNPDGGRGNILFVGRLVKRKGLEDLLGAFEIVSKSLPDARLVVVGDGPFRDEFAELVRESPAGKNVSMKGMLTGPPLYQEYAACDVFVMPSRTTRTDTEGFGMVFLEAAFFSRPSVGTKSGGIPEAVVDGETGLLADQGDVLGLARRIKELLEDRSLASRLGENGRKRVLSGFTWASSTDRFLRAYGLRPGTPRAPKLTQPSFNQERGS